MIVGVSKHESGSDMRKWIRNAKVMRESGCGNDLQTPK